jgi:carboxyl-terminal processing protease
MIGELVAKKPCGWIVDLRGNLGGNVFPMLAGIGPLLDKGNVAYALDADGQKTLFFYENGRAGLHNPDGKEVIVTKVENWLSGISPGLPIAVLIDRETASSGELIAISFRGRANTRFFGESTLGASTSTRGFRLSDGVNMVLATAVDVDRSGKEYPTGVSPDEVVAIGDKVAPINEDPVIHAALGWIGEQLK